MMGRGGIVGQGNMALDPKAQAALALHRFGFGPRAGTIAAIASDPRGVLLAEFGFAERLVWFWSNHFCVSADKVRPLAGAYEREAIRAHALGRFADMLLAVEAHPAMLVYLDNARSIGPKSPAGINRGKG